MKRSVVSVVGAVFVAVLFMVAEPGDCFGQTGTSFPEPGKAISIYVGFAAGGASDISARLLAVALEKQLGVPVQVVAKPGASSQIAMAALARSKPDGYTLGQGVFAPFLVTYLDPSRQASYTRKEFQAVAHYGFAAMVFAVKASAPYKTLKDLVEAARANPGKIRVGTSGILSNSHMMALALERTAGVKFSYVHFRGSGEGIPAVLGGHVEVGAFGFPESVPQHRSGALRILASTEKASDKILPDVKTFVEQGYAVTLTSANGLITPAGTPKAIVQVLSDAVKKAVETPEFRDKAKTMGLTPDYMDTAHFEAWWSNYEKEVRPMIESNKGK
jgi:tripartite-type tricarboxylate transporter receptor subunit TctC